MMSALLRRLNVKLISKELLISPTLEKSKLNSNTKIITEMATTRQLHISSIRKSNYTKKKGEFIEVKKEKDTSDGLLVKQEIRVKLYPGFQTSLEERQQQEALNKNNEDIYAKKVIEDFYGLGLNELEVDDFKTKEKENAEFEDETAIFDLDYAVQLLKKENVQDICCINIPKEANYADYMIIGTCLSDKHLNSTFFAVNSKYKKLKRLEARLNEYADLKESSFIKFQNKTSGKESKWCAIDIGEMVIHLFLDEEREYYDLEGLWTCGPEFDNKYLEFYEKQREWEKNLFIVEDDDLINQTQTENKK